MAGRTSESQLLRDIVGTSLICLNDEEIEELHSKRESKDRVGRGGCQQLVCLFITP